MKRQSDPAADPATTRTDARSRVPALRVLAVLSLALVIGHWSLVISFAAPAPAGKPSAYPPWWFEREVIRQTAPPSETPSWPQNYRAADDYAAANIGQLKSFATAAYDELQAHFPGGAGPAVETLIKGWFQLDENNGFLLDAQGQRQPKVTGATDDYAAANLGQLKAVAKPFYDRLIAMHFLDSYPWASGASPDDYAAANLGQVKNLFSFDIAFDGDGNGLPDWWEQYYFGRLGVDPASSIPDSPVTIDAAFQAGLNPHTGEDSAEDEGDRDGDEVADIDDHFPNDGRRSESVPVKYYGAIDLTADLPGFPAVSHIAIGEDNQVAFLGTSEEETQVAIWKDGVAQAATIPPVDMGWFPAPLALNSRGQVFGGLWDDGEAYLWRFSAGNLAVVDSTVTDYGLPHIGGVSDSGMLFGAYRWQEYPVNFTNHWQNFFGWPGSLQVFARDSLGGEDFSGAAISPGGICVGYHSVDGEGGPAITDGEVFSPVPAFPSVEAPWLNPYAINDYWQVVGASYAFDADGNPLGFYYSPANGTQNFHSLLPEKYRQQLRAAIPFLITNPDPVTGQPTIVFRAVSLEGDSSGDWITRTFSLSWTPEGEAVIAETYVSTGEGGSELDLQLRTINAKGLAVAFEDSPLLIEPMEFQAVNINLGFDLPIANDQQILGGDRDKKGEWWTSVISEPASGRVNDNIKFVCTGGQPPAAKLGVEAKDKLADHLIVTDPGNFTAETPIKMTAKPDADRQQRTTQVIVKTKRPNGDLGRTVQVLNVDVLPLRTIKLGIWFLHDTVHDAPMVPVAFRNTTRIIDELNAIYESQAGIRFVLDTENAGPLDWVFDFPNDSGPPDGKLDDTDVPWNAELPQILSWELPSKVNLVLTNQFLSGNLGFTRDETNRSIIATEPFAATRGMDDFFTTCAHEIGHQLGLSTRWPKPDDQPRQEHHNHDAQYFPVRDYYEDGRRVTPYAKRLAKPDSEINQRLRYGLMTQGTPPGKWHWIRHEDWRAANQNAILLAEP